MDRRTLIISILGLFFISPSLFGGERVTPIGLKLIKLKRVRELPETCIYNQVMNYSTSKPFGDVHGRSTNVHETVHGINSYIRNTYYKENINGLYAGNGYGIKVINPKLKLRQIQNYVPHSLRGYRYNLYFVKQLRYWDDTPTYHLDEWSAYIAGAESAVDDAIQKIVFKEKSDSVSGALEFSIYCTALAMATRDLDKNYWENNLQLKNTINYFLIKAEKVFFEGRDLYPSQAQETLLKNLRENEDAKYIREILISDFQSIFLN
jgi:hypothetical protein